MTEPSNHMISALRKTYWITNANSLAEKSLLNALPAVVFRGGLENIKRLTFQLKESCQICHHLLMYEWIILDLLKSRAVATWSKNIDSCIHAIRLCVDVDKSPTSGQTMVQVLLKQKELWDTQKPGSQQNTKCCNKKRNKMDI